MRKYFVKRIQTLDIEKNQVLAIALHNIRFAHKKAKEVAGRQQARHKGLYDRRCKGATLGIGDLVLVKKTAWKGRHKITG